MNRNQQHMTDNWKKIDSAPVGVPIRIKTVTGQIRIAKINKYNSSTYPKHGKNCWSCDRKTQSDLVAVEWMPLEGKA